MGEPVQPTADQLRAVTEAQTPEEYMRAAAAAGLTGDAEQAALAGAKPVEAPDFAAMLAQFKADQQAQIDKMQADFDTQLAALRSGIPAPLVDPRVSVARNLSDGLILLLRQYPAATARVAPLADANASFAAGLVPEDGAETPVPLAGVVEDVIKKFRRFALANPTLETGLIEHAAQITEDVFDL
ncbi:MAG TPA: hypothetical protein VGR98_12300 [Streptosporangiaceae bacterium]|nr:hypothetical protein [Streptosporangiaceae bacterium]